jgi:phosphinothricin acetyltransferase
VIGYARGREWRSRDAYRWTTEVGIYLDPSHHGAGAGRALYTELLALLAGAGFHSAIGGITLPNPASIALHTALGFAHVGTVRDAGWKHGAWHDVAFYQRLFQPTATPPGAIDTDSRST